MVYRFNPAPGWPAPPPGWVPPQGWVPDASWPPAPAGWTFWVEVPEPAAAPLVGPGAPVGGAGFPPPPAHLPAAAAAPASAGVAPAAAPLRAPAPLAHVPAPAGPGPVPAPRSPALSAPKAPDPAAQPVGLPYAPQLTPAHPSAPSPSVPYAEYRHDLPPAAQPSQWSSTPALLGTPGLIEERPRRSNPLLWIIPLTIVLVGLIIFGILAIAGAFDSDGTRDRTVPGAPSAAATPTAPEPPAPTVEPLAEPSPDVEQADDGAFCTDVMSLFTAFGTGISRETAAEFVTEYEPAVAAMAGATVPAELAEAWEFNRSNDTSMLAELKAGDPSLKPMEAYISYNVKAFTDDGNAYEAAETSINEYAQTHCF